MIPIRAPRLRLALEACFAAALVLAVVGGLAAGCDPNAVTPLLVPTGGGGGSCTSTFSSMRMVGDFTNPSFTISASPIMQLVRVNDECVWRVAVTLNAGPVLFKFVTDEDFDTTKDYGGSEAITLPVPGGPHATSLVSGTGTAIKVDVAATGDYIFTLNEQTLTWTAAPGPPPPTGGVAGTVSFANLVSPPFPVAHVVVSQGAVEIASTDSDPTTRTFSVTGLVAGSYDVTATASCFTPNSVPGVSISGSTVNVGDLALGEGASTFTTIDLVGGFNLFTPGADPMVQTPTCVWTRDRVLAPGVFNMKFLTDGTFDTPPDYGGDESITIDVPGNGTVRPVSGPGTAIKISVANGGTYRFVLDERVQRWSAELLPPAPARVGGR